MKKILVIIMILLFVGISMSPTILGLIKENQKIFHIKNIESDHEYLDFREQKNFQPIEELCKFYNIKYDNQFIDDYFKRPIFSSSYFDYTIKGYITDETTNNPIKDAIILIISSVAVGSGSDFSVSSTWLVAWTGAGVIALIVS